MKDIIVSPYISVILPVYNAEKYITEAVCSILNQTFKNFELIIINDGSTDASSHIIDELASTDDRIRVFHRENSGLIKTLNFGLKQSKGHYIARMDADDISCATRFEKQVNFLNDNPHIVLCGSQVEFIGARSGISNLPTNEQDCMIQLQFSTPVFHPTVMFRKVPLEYNMNYLHSEDFKYWSDITSYGNIMNVSDILLKYRVHENQISRLNNVDQLRQQLRISQENIMKFLPFGLDGYGYCEIVSLIINNDVFCENPKRTEIALYYNLAFFGFKGWAIHYQYTRKYKLFNLKKSIKLLFRTLKWFKFKYD